MSIKGVTLSILATGLSTALLNDEQEFEDQGGFDISGGLYGKHVSNWIREVESIINEKPIEPNWNKLKKLAGYYQNATEEVVTLSQDDATRSYWIKVGKEANYGSCFEEALSKFEVRED